MMKIIMIILIIMAGRCKIVETNIETINNDVSETWENDTNIVYFDYPPHQYSKIIIGYTNNKKEFKDSSGNFINVVCSLSGNEEYKYFKTNYWHYYWYIGGDSCVSYGYFIPWNYKFKPDTVLRIR